MSTPAEIDHVQATLVKVLQKVLEDAVAAATGAQDRVADIADEAIAKGEAAVAAGEQAVEDARDIAGAQLAKLKQLAEHPDWLGALIIALTTLVDNAGDPDLSVHAVPPEAGFAKAIGLRHLLPSPDPVRPSAILALAIDKSGVNAPATTGLVIKLRGGGQHEIGDDPVHLRLTGDGIWRIPFAGPIGVPDGAFTLEATFHQATGFAEGDPGGVLSVGTGALDAKATLSGATGQPTTWSLRLGLDPDGADHPAGVHADVHLAKFLGAVAAFISIGDLSEKYSPGVELAAKRAPRFDLGHASG